MFLGSPIRNEPNSRLLVPNDEIKIFYENDAHNLFKVGIKCF